MSRLRLLADEQMPMAIVEYLRSRGYKVWTAHELALKDDDSVIARAREMNLLVLTIDRDFRNEDKFPICTHPGILLLKLGDRTESAMLAAMKSFIRSGHRSKGKHAYVELTEKHCVITNLNGHEFYRYE